LSKVNFKKLTFWGVTIVFVLVFITAIGAWVCSSYSVIVFNKHSVSAVSRLRREAELNLAEFKKSQAQGIEYKEKIKPLQMRRAHPFCGFRTEPSVQGEIGYDPIQDSHETDAILDGFRGLIRGHKFFINHAGFRSPILEPKKAADTIRIAMLGSSSVWLGSENEKTIIAQLASLFQKNGQKIEYINAGIVSAVVSQELSVLVHDITDLEVDLVISFDGFNDIVMLTNYSGRIGWPPMKRASYYPFVPPTPRIHARKLAIAVDQYLSTIDKMARICDEFGIKYIATLQPSLDYARNKDALFKAKQIARVAFFQAVVEEFAKRDKAKTHGGHYISMADSVDEKLYMDLVHFNDEGNGIVADRLYKIIEERGILKD
jgi:lysophospholipase L1-like esterase